MGRKPLMALSGLTFVLSIPMIALAHGYGPLFFGRLLQGVSGGLIGVVVPLYLAECLSASTRGKGTGIFQWLLTLGIVSAAVIGIYYSYRVEAVLKVSALRRYSRSRTRRGGRSSGFRCRRAFCSCLAVYSWRSLRGGCFCGARRSWLTPRCCVRASRNRRIPNCARWGRQRAQSRAEGQERSKDTLLRRKYVIPFLLACVILFCNTATGVNSIIGYNTSILLQSGLSDLMRTGAM